MSKKMYFLISFVLVLVLAGNVLAWEIVMWDNYEGAGDRLWKTSTNWTVLGYDDPVLRRAPQIGDSVGIDDYADDGNCPIINADTNAITSWLDLGYMAPPASGYAALKMTGGSLQVGGWMEMGAYYPGTYRFDMSGGTISGCGGWGVAIGWVDQSYNTFNMSGGTFNSDMDFRIGPADTSQADMNMTGGTVNIDGWLDIGGYGTNLGKSHLDVHGGTITAAALGIGGGGPGTMDLANDGTLIVYGDYRMPNGWLYDPCSDDYTGTIAILAKRGTITTYNTNVGDIITDGNYPDEMGLRAVLNINYDAGQTTITAGAVDPNLAWNPDPVSGAGGLSATDVNLLSWAAGNNAAGHDVYFGTSFGEVNDANTNTAGIYRGPTQPLADVNYALPVECEWDTTYYWRIDEVNGATTWKGTVWSFVTAKAWATNPGPGNGASGVSPLVVLSWEAGPEAADVNGHEVYFGTSWDEVNDANRSTAGIYRGPGDVNKWVDLDPCDPNIVLYTWYTYDPPEDLDLLTEYFWRIDEVNNNEDPNVWPGEVWSFTTVDHLIVEDFSYVNTGVLNDTWHDWVTTSDGTGQYNAEVKVETYIVRDGNSMWYNYHNDHEPGFSESWAYASALGPATGTDWTFGGAEALVLSFYGDPENTPDPVYDQMWVGLEDGSGTFAKVNCDDLNDVAEASWHEWNIRLQDFNDINNVDLTDVSKIYIGFGVRGGSGENGTEGVIYFEDIQLWVPRCVPEKVATDFTGDCITDYGDLDIMARDWLLSDREATSTSPSVAPQIWYRFDEGSGTTINNDGDLGPSHDANAAFDLTTEWVSPGAPAAADACDPSSALRFNGTVDDYIEIPPLNLNSNTVTITAWVKLDGEQAPWAAFAMNRLGGARGLCLGESGWSLRYGWENWSWYWDSGLNVPDNQWTFIAVAVEPEQATLYMSDGVTLNLATSRRIHNPETFGGRTCVGGDADYDDERRIKGPMDDFRIYDKTLGAGEIMYLAGGIAGTMYVPVQSPTNLTDPEAQLSRKVNFKDYRILADNWLEEPALWPW